MLLNSNMQGWRRASTTPKALVLNFYAQDGSYFVKAGPDLTYSDVLGSEPSVVDGVMRGDPAYTSLTQITDTLIVGGGTVTKTALPDDWAEYTKTTTSIYAHLVSSTGSTGAVKTFIVELLAGSGANADGASFGFYDYTNSVGLSSSAEVVSGPAVLSLDGSRHKVSSLSPTELAKIKITLDAPVPAGVDCKLAYYPGGVESGSTTGTSNLLRYSMVSDGPFLFRYIPPGTSSVSLAGTVGGNGGSFDTSGDIAKSLALRQALEGAPDGVELVVNGDFSNELTDWTPTVQGSSTVTVDAGSITIVRDDGNVYLVPTNHDMGFLTGANYQLVVEDVSSTVASFEIVLQDHTQILDIPINATGTLTSTFSGDTAEYVVIRNLKSNGLLSFSNISIQKLNQATPTIAALVEMGVGSDELVDGDLCNVLTTDDTAAHGLFYGCDSTGSYLACSDGTTTIKAYTTWDRNSNILLELVATADGSQFKLGYKRYTEDGAEIDSAVQYSALNVFAGSLPVEDYMRKFFNNTVPVGDRAVEVWSEPQEEATILKYMEKRLPNA